MKKNEQGFTLVELIVGMAILSLIMSGVYGVLASSIKSYQYNFEQGQDIQDSRQIFNEITKGIKYATAVTSPDTRTLNYSIDTNDYIVTLNLTTKAVEITKNTDATRSYGTGRVNDINFDLVPKGTKQELTIQLSFTSNSTQPLKTAVMTLNDIL